MLTPVNSTTPSALKLPAKAHVDTASASLFGMVFQQNTKQFATLETAQAIAKMLGGTVVDLSDQWGGGSQSPQYAIQMGLNGPVLNAGLIAQRCENCGVESGLSAALVETGRMLGSPISDAEALAKVRANALATAQPTPAVPVTMAPPATIQNTIAAGVTDTAVATPDASPLSNAAQTSEAVSTTSESKLAESSKQFEALMIGQLLKSVREESAGGWMGSEEGGAQTAAVEFGETQLAQAIAANGGLGLAQMVLRSMGTVPAKAPNSGS